jgi:TonB family protein
MQRSAAVTCVFLFLALAFIPPSLAQQDNTEGNRKILSRPNPHYPDIARTMSLKGSVRVEAVVAPNGIVKSVEVKGGHPVLVRAAQDAIYKWKWSPASHETREPIEIKFNPQ